MELQQRYHAPHWQNFALLRKLAPQLAPTLTTEETMPIYEDDGDDAEATDSSTLSSSWPVFRLDVALLGSDPRAAPSSIPPPPNITVYSDNQISIQPLNKERREALLEALSTTVLPPGLVQFNAFSVLINNEDPTLLRRVMSIFLPVLQRLGQVNITPTTPDQADVLGLDRLMALRLHSDDESRSARQLSRTLDVAPKRRRAWD